MKNNMNICRYYIIDRINDNENIVPWTGQIVFNRKQQKPSPNKTGFFVVGSLTYW